MPWDHEESIALASVYADALVEAADAIGEGELVAEELADLLRWMDANPDFEVFLATRAVDDDPRRESLERLFRGRMNDLLLNCLQVMNNRWRLDLVRALNRCVELLMERRHNEQEVVVETAVPLTDELREEIKAVVGEKIGKSVLLIEKIDPGLIAGMILRVEDRQIDGSVSSHAIRLHRRLRDRMTEAVHHGEGVEGQWA